MMSLSLRSARTALLSAFLMIGLAAPAQAQFGVAGGLNFESAGDIETSTSNNGTFDNSTGYHIGVVYELGLGAATIRPGFLYRRVGEFEFSQSALPNIDDPRFGVSAWQGPVALRFTVLPTPLVSP